ncbi:hypothetical protein ACFFV8_16345 [Sphingobium indicum]|uniref:Uncharacterized protein n=1 Tax=Sphingobium indicum F2 TaxID=1450518 RepID=A0A8E0WQK9_9SPHN|nr:MULTISPECIES: hypothetical protein [Sphingobium]EQB04362.1 hypothetical protein L286_10650 [Sphingobium sp. HDIP04]KER35592.1 hypothetical protein AL00_15325 [Sphingobium indicum F2]
MKKKSTMPLRTLTLICLIFAAQSRISAAQPDSDRMVAQSSERVAGLSYADIADLADAAPLVAQARIGNIIKLKPGQAGAVPPGHQRVYVEANVGALIRGEGGISPTVRYLYDAPLDARGKMPKLKKAQVILFARPGGRPGEIQLIARDAQILATPAETERVKAILSELVAVDAPPRIVGLGDAFHVAGTIAGEGETQIFLRTENGDPVSLSILRRPGQQPRWAVALGEIVDEAARPPAPGSLLWYRLACGLPDALPARSVRALSPQDAELTRADYRIVLDALGPCGRTRTVR